MIAGIVLLSVIITIPLLNKVIAYSFSDNRLTNTPIDAYINTIKFFEEELQRTDLKNEERAFYEGKLSSFVIPATQRAVGLANQNNGFIELESTPTNVGGNRIPDGINNTPSAPFSQSVFTSNNFWLKTTGDGYYLVYAGFLTQDQQQGAVYVLHPSTHNFVLYSTPERNGAVRVIAENNTTITLESDNQALFYFDAAIEQYVDAQGNPFPTVVFRSTVTPIPYP